MSEQQYIHPIVKGFVMASAMWVFMLSCTLLIELYSIEHLEPNIGMMTTMLIWAIMMIPIGVLAGYLHALLTRGPLWEISAALAGALWLVASFSFTLGMVIVYVNPPQDLIIFNTMFWNAIPGLWLGVVSAIAPWLIGRWVNKPDRPEQLGFRFGKKAENKNQEAA